MMQKLKVVHAELIEKLSRVEAIKAIRESVEQTKRWYQPQ